MKQEHMLTREEYEGGKHWTKLSAERKHKVFDIYEAYCKHREELRGWDIGQRNLALYKRLRSRPREEVWLAERCPFDHVSVDEVQDATAVELALVLAACGDQPNNLSLFGDTTQQVTPGLVGCLIW